MSACTNLLAALLGAAPAFASQAAPLVECLHERMPFERRLHDPALDAFPASMNQPHLPQPRLVRRVDVFLDH